MSNGLLIIVVLCVATLSLAAVPPLSREQLRAEATLVVTGTIKSVATSTNKAGEDRSDTCYRIAIEVQSVEKGDASFEGRTVEATTWRPAQRPRGWTGDQGQNTKPVEGTSVRCHLRADEKDGFKLLTPNGLELLAPATAPATQPD